MTEWDVRVVWQPNFGGSVLGRIDAKVPLVRGGIKRAQGGLRHGRASGHSRQNVLSMGDASHERDAVHKVERIPS